MKIMSIKYHIKRLATACAFMILCHANTANAAMLADPSRLCMDIMPTYERTYGIPAKVLLSIAQGESGIYNKSTQGTVPWPWTIGVAGEGHYYKTEKEAVDGLKKILASGARNVDIGCMQVNMMHHPDAFGSIETAFNPAANIAYAAKFLRNNYDETRSWKTAVQYYHSRNSEFGEPYVNKFIKRWMANNGYKASGKGMYAKKTVNAVVDAYPVAANINSSSYTSSIINGAAKGAAIGKVSSQKSIKVEQTKKSPLNRSGMVIKVQDENGIRVVRMTPVSGEKASIQRSQIAQASAPARASGNKSPVDFIFD